MSKIIKLGLATILLFTTCTNLSPLFIAQAKESVQLKPQDLIPNPKEVSKYLEQGFTQEEIYRGMLISKFSKKDVSEVLQTYKETKSWRKTAKIYDVDLKVVMKEHFKQNEELLKTYEDDVLVVLALVNGVTTEKLTTYLNQGIPLRLLVAFSAINKNANIPLDDLVKLKQSGASLEKIHEQAKTNHQTIHEDMHYILEQIRQEIEKNHPDALNSNE